jgi:PAS domain S-box-containing protein
VILAVVRDITDRIRAEAVQRESEQKFKSIFDTASDGILVAEPESKKIILANKSAAFMLGYRGDEIINLSVPDLHRAEDLEYVLGEFHKFLQGQIWQSIDIPFRRKDGSLLHVDMSAAAINIGERKCMVAVLRDASARKKIEEELSKSNERFRTLVSNIPGAAYRSRCDAEYITEFVSDAIEQISGYPASDFMGNKVRSYPSIIHPEDRQVVQEIILEAVRKKQPYILEYRIIHANGETRWVYERGQGVFDAQGNVLYCDGAIFDFTERKQIDLALREKVRDLEIFHKVAVGRELRLEELKKRIKDLESQLQ